MKFNKKLVLLLSFIMSITFVYFVQSQDIIKPDVKSKADKKIENAIVLYVGSPTSYVNNLKTQIDAEDQEIYPTIKNDRAIVPIRFISEKLGAVVEWNEKSQTAILKLNNKEIKLTINSNKMYVNGGEIKLDAVPEIKNGRMFIPLRAISEAFDKEVFWDKGLIIISDIKNIIDIGTEQEIIDEVISRVNILPTVNSFENLQKLLASSEKKSPKRNYLMKEMFTDGIMTNAKSEDAVSVSESIEQSSSDDYSTTNVQVQGVDEADIVKNDGEYIYHVNSGKVNIIKAFPAEQMKTVSTIKFEQNNFSPLEIYVDNNKLVVIGNSYNNYSNVMNKSIAVDENRLMPIYYYPQNTTIAIIYDITDKQNPEQIREVEVDGYYVSSRKVESTLYLVANKNVGYHILRENNGIEENILPMYKDTLIKDDFVNIDYKDIMYLPDFVEPNFLVVAGIDIEGNEKANISTYLGTGNNIYSSKDNLYIATNNYKYENTKLNLDIISNPRILMPIYTQNTLVYKFGLESGNVIYKGKGEVPGTILNQFSMDESNEHFRIATTTQPDFMDNESLSQNNIYILDKNMFVVGQIENLAAGERIYSVRFMGDRGYIVTFKTVDPLFVIDLKEPTAPKVLGQLKIPGFSDYLHPYDENHIIGFGNDTMEIPVKDSNGRIINTAAITTGMKLAIFDVSDVSNPIQKHVEKIGGRGTHSQLMYNHKSLLFSKAKNLLAFPVSVAEERVNSDGIPEYGQTIFKGAYVYNVDMENGFNLKGKITHFEDNYYGYYEYNGEIQRIIYIGDNLYTVSNSMIKANDLSSLKEINKINN